MARGVYRLLSVLCALSLVAAVGCAGRGLTASKTMKEGGLGGASVSLAGTATSSNGTIWTVDGGVITSHVGDTFTASLNPGKGAYIHGTGTARAISFSNNAEGVPEILVAAGDDVEASGVKFNPESGTWDFERLTMKTSPVIAVQMEAFQWANEQLKTFAPAEAETIMETARSQNAALIEVLPEVVSVAASLGIEAMKRIYPIPEITIGGGPSGGTTDPE